MSPKGFYLAGLGLILLAVAVGCMLGDAIRSDPWRPFYYWVEANFLEFLVISLVGGGFVSILRGLKLALGGELPRPALPRIFPELKLQNVTRWKKRSDRTSLVAASWNAFSVSWICVLMTLVTIFMILNPPPRNGLRIDWTQRSHISAVESPWPETMSVYIGRHKQVYVNGKAIERQELEKNLRAELARRAVWTVYLEADDDTTFSETVSAIDTIQGVGAKVVWITPMMRAEWQKGNHSGQQ
ncbi:MAG TPA: biopolymer transporter ExbD [Candidatus Acidoferrum sp.]|nr:biopolymer transporter ExbD [Candidatus Acidoferrum sp.]